MVYTTYKNGDDWGMVNMALFYPHYMFDAQKTSEIRTFPSFRGRRVTLAKDAGSAAQSAMP
jgi:hypothetical protein